MSKEAKHTLIPKLRFPEFREAEGWPYLHGDEIFNQISDKNHNSDLPILAITQEQGAIPRNEIDYNVSVTEKSVESYKIVNISDFIISLRSFQGGIEYSNYTGICSPAYIILRKKLDIDELFFKYYFKSDVLIKDLNKNLEGIRDGKMISFKQFSDVLLPIPTKKEQQKIAATLTSLDELISAQGEKIKALQAHKKGLMQQLFPAEGETTPRLRFGEFEGEWEEKALGDICRMQAGKFVSASAIFEKASNDFYPCYGGNGLRGYTKSFTHMGKYPLIGRQGALCGNVILASEKFHATEHAVVATPNKGVDTDWLFYLLIYMNLNQFATGQAQPGLSVENLEKVRSSIPKKEKEQQKIAAALFTLDDLISAQNQKLEALKTLKKGLMQQLFPNQK